MRVHPAETMKKTLLMILSVCLVAACLTGCGKEKSNFSLGEYKGLKYAGQTFEAKDEEVDNLVKALENQYITYETLEDRQDTEVKNGDIVNIDYEGILVGQSTPFDGGTAKGAHLEIGSGNFIDGFESGLIGKKPGETVVLNLQVPDQYYENVAGKKVNFTVKINAIEKKVVPTVTDEMVADYTEGLFKTVEEYRNYARQYIIKQKESTFMTALKDELLKQVISTSKFDKLDEKKLESYYNDLVNYYSALASSKGISMETYIAAYYGNTSESAEVLSEKFYAELKNVAEKTMKEELVLNEIISKEKITLTDEKYKSMISDYMTKYGYSEQADFEAAYTVEKIRQSMLYDLAMQALVDYAVAQ